VKIIGRKNILNIHLGIEIKIFEKNIKIKRRKI
jgi:hypothetical protein